MNMKLMGTIEVYSTIGTEPLDKKELEGEKGTITIGRRAMCDLCIPSPRISEQHAEIGWKDGKVWIIDMGSKHGTKVGDTDVTTDAAWLKDKDVMYLAGVIKIVFSVPTSDDDLPITVAEPDEPTVLRPATSSSRSTPPPLPPVVLSTVAPPPPLNEATMVSGPPAFDAVQTDIVRRLPKKRKNRSQKKWLGKTIITLLLIALSVASIFKGRHEIKDFAKKNLVSADRDEGAGTMLSTWPQEKESHTVSDFLDKPDMKQAPTKPDMDEPAKPAAPAPALAPTTKATATEGKPKCLPYKIGPKDYWQAVIWAAGVQSTEKAINAVFLACNPGEKITKEYKEGDMMYYPVIDGQPPVTSETVAIAIEEIAALKTKAKKKAKKSLDKDF